jgi:serine/threonine protein kinase
MKPLLNDDKTFLTTMELSAMMKARGTKHVLQSITTGIRGNGAVVVEYARFGNVLDLTDHLEFTGKSLSPSDVEEILKHARVGVAELETLGLRHGDLHARNILIFSYNPILAKLGDLGECSEGKTYLHELDALESEIRALL